MKTILLLSALLLSGCDFIGKLPPVEVCVMYKGKKFCASKVAGKWTFTTILTPEEESEVIGNLEK